MAGRRKDKAAFTGAKAGAARDSIFPANVTEALADIALGTDDDRPKRHVHARDSADPRPVKAASSGNSAEFAVAVDVVITSGQPHLGHDPKRPGSNGRRNFLCRLGGTKHGGQRPGGQEY